MERFWAKVLKREDHECWTWQGYCDPDGYGEIRVEGKKWRTHRFSWYLQNGDIPEGAMICHHCDNPPCVNPSHLFVSNNQGNMDDMRWKGRAKRGTSLDPKLIEEILMMRREGKTYKVISQRCGVSLSTAHRIVKEAKGLTPEVGALDSRQEAQSD